jgi:uncharacterized protein YqiB (DUF1249 family)
VSSRPNMLTCPIARSVDIETLSLYAANYAALAALWPAGNQAPSSVQVCMGTAPTARYHGFDHAVRR